MEQRFGPGAIRFRRRLQLENRAVVIGGTAGSGRAIKMARGVESDVWVGESAGGPAAFSCKRLLLPQLGERQLFGCLKGVGSLDLDVRFDADFRPIGF